MAFWWRNRRKRYEGNISNNSKISPYLTTNIILKYIYKRKQFLQITKVFRNSNKIFRKIYQLRAT